ncbi:peptidase inhibitor I78 [Sphingomonas edaphi]|uniref:Peptidase inhibitor I78 n=2 Tax=Sphingomonas edaphi TaxID=2315689 RepID=A0A418Q1A2_9SPHN|nr:peptidase inhibitor I78 [Sphingomonas edaphi]
MPSKPITREDFSMRSLMIALGMVPLSACMTTPSGHPGTGEPVMACNNEALEQFVGQPASQELGGRMLAASGARMIRWVPKGGVVTMDFRGDRLTIGLDDANRVETARCG